MTGSPGGSSGAPGSAVAEQPLAADEARAQDQAHEHLDPPGDPRGQGSDSPPEPPGDPRGQGSEPASEPPPDRAALVWRAKGIIVLAAGLVGVATFVICTLLPATYEATATVRVAAQSGSTSQEAVLASNDLASQYAQLVSSAPVLRASEIDLSLAPGALDAAVSGGTVGDQNLIGVNVRAGDADEAGVWANAVATNLVAELQRANKEQAGAYAERVDEQLAPLDRRIAAARGEIARLSRQVANGGANANAAATILASRQSNLSSLESQRDSVASNVAQVAAVVQPSVTVWSRAGAGGQVQPKPYLYSVVAFILTALVVAQLAVTIGSRKGTDRQ